jgi:uncharacterized cofD-like protein
VGPFEKKPSAFKWLHPGMKVKRWLVLLLVGTTILALSFAYLLRSIYDTWTFPSVVYYLTLQFVPREWRAVLFGVVGLVAVGIAVIQLNRSLLAALLTPGHDKVVDIVYKHRIQMGRGPKIVVIGGGTGLSTLLRGLKNYSSNIAAIVTVTDDGGSSGRIREDLGMLPPGDFRDCIVALADDESMVARLFQYRFGGENELGGHSFGNLFIAAMAGITGNFERAILESSRVLAVRGRSLPSTLDNVTLCAEVLGHEGNDSQIRHVEGESRIPKQGRVIQRVYLKPDGVRAYPGALRAILNADLIVIGPGSLYTSIIPNLLIGEIAAAIRATPAAKVYICNAATQIGETENFSAEDHVETLRRYVGDVFLHVLINNNFDVEFPDDWVVALVSMQNPTVKKSQYHTIEGVDVIDPENPWRHHSPKLAEEVMKLYESLKANQSVEEMPV